MRGSLQERSAVLHLINKQDRANQSPLRIRLTVVTSAGRGPVMCASPLLSRKTPVFPKPQSFFGEDEPVLSDLKLGAARRVVLPPADPRALQVV